MELSIQTENGAVVVAIKGNLDAATAPELEAKLADAMADGSSSIVLDLRELAYISSAGLRVLLSTAKEMKAASRAFVLCSLQEAVEQVFEISGFSGILNITESKEAALSQA